MPYHLWLPTVADASFCGTNWAKPSTLLDPRLSLRPSVGACYSSLQPWAMMALFASLGPSTVGMNPVGDVVWGPGCSLKFWFGLDHSIRDGLMHWA